jgi:hypothetical protein
LTYIYLAIAFLVGFVAAWVFRTMLIFSLKKELKRTNGLLESERLVKETLRKESALAFQLKESSEAELGRQLQEAQHMLKMMDQDILLLQRNNEETEAFYQKSHPELHQLKLKLIEANNTIARMKAQQKSHELQTSSAAL